MTNKKTVLCVIRVSTEKQETEGQKKEMLEFCTSLGFPEDSIEWIEVAGASARKLNDKYIQMLEDIKNKIISISTIKAVAFWHLNRLGRVESKLMEMKEWFIVNKIQVYIKNPSIKLFEDNGKTSPSAEMAWSLFATMVKFDTEEMMEKFTRGKNNNRDRMKFNGGRRPLFGYCLDENNIYQIDKEESKIVKLIFDEYSTGRYSINSLQTELDKRGTRRPDGNKLPYAFIINVLKEPAYYGGGGVSSRGKKSERKYPVIIPKEQWDKCKEIKDGNNCGFDRSRGNKHIGSKIVKCSYCNNNMTPSEGHYRCWKYYRKFISGLESQCDCNITIKESLMNKLIWEFALKLHLEYLKDLGNNTITVYRNKIKIYEEKLNEVNKKILDLGAKRVRIADLYAEGDYTKHKYLDAKGKLVSEHLGLQRQQEELTDEIEHLNELIYNIKHGKAEKSFDPSNVSDEEKYEIAHMHIKKASFIPEDGGFCKLITIEAFNGLTEKYRYYYQRRLKPQLEKMED